MGLGAPSITVAQTGLSIGRAVIQHTLGRRFHLNDYMTWQRAAHRARFGVDWEHHRGGTLTWNNEPATLTLFSPQQARQADIPLPSTFSTLDDILQLPLQSVLVGVGDPRVLQEDGSLARTWNTLRLFFQDTWRLHSCLTVNYGLGWNIDRNLNCDLTKPSLLVPILGADGLGPTRKEWNNFSPVLGLAWAPRRDGKTVIRAGAGIFYDFYSLPCSIANGRCSARRARAVRMFPEADSSIACRAFRASRLEGLSTSPTRQRGLPARTC